MPLWTSPDGRYTIAMQTPGEGDGNTVVYDNWKEAPSNVWDRFSYEAANPIAGPVGSSVPSPSAPPPPSVGRRVIKVTDESDGRLLNRMYAYWSNAWVSGGSAYVFVGHEDNHPRFFRVNLSTGAVDRLGSLVPYIGEAEGWYWDEEGWIYLIDGPRFRRFNPFSGEDRVVYDISSSHPNCVLWQPHSSQGGRTHSATLQRIVSEGSYPKLGTITFHNGQLKFHEAVGDLDESALAGKYLVIQERINGSDDNRIINLDSNEERRITDHDRAVGHSDCGDGFVVGEADKPDPGACVYVDLNTLEKRILFLTLNMGHVSVRNGRCLLSGPTHLSLVDLGSGSLTALVEHGMVGSDYDHQVEGNLDPSGQVAAYMSNNGSSRFDLSILVL